jgi:hypothetical protein
MRFLLLFVGWVLLLVLAWPLALAVLVLAPIVWLIALPFRVVGICVSATLALVRGILFLPARLLGQR